MAHFKSVEEAYDACLVNGNFINLEDIQIDKINSLFQAANITINSAKTLAKHLQKISPEWMNVFTMSYEVLRNYAEALLLLKNLQSNSDLGIFSALCLKYSHLELDWFFLERLRIKSQSLAEGEENINYADWKSIELQLNLYLSSLREEIEKRLA